MKKLICICLILVMSFNLCSCGNSQTDGTDKKEKLVIAYQWGLAYAPLEIMKQKKLIEKHYGKDLDIEWKTCNGILAGSIDIGHSGVGPFLINSMKTKQIKMYSAMSAQPMGLNTTDKSIQSIKDIGKDEKIAIIGWGTIQHVMLAMACEKELGNAHALDNNMVTMSHPDGMQALLLKYK